MFYVCVCEFLCLPGADWLVAERVVQAALDVEGFCLADSLVAVDL